MANCVEPNFKHYCRVCKKGFMCGRALGGHMRAHGIGDDQNGNFDEDRVSDWEEKFGGISDGTNNKRMYRLRTNPNRLKSSRNCENCGKEFLCWKSFLEHGKCSSDDASKALTPSSESEDEEDDRTRGSGWSKRKRSLRAKVGSFNSTYPSSAEDEDLILAKCLVQLANSRAYPLMDEPEESCTSASREEERRNSTAYLGPLMSRAPYDKAKGISKPVKGLFECKACKKVFNSHQALGGHRASHKKVKGCYATKQDQVGDNNLTYDMFTQEEFFPTKSTNSSSQFEQGPAVLVGAARRKSKVHECTICHRVFSSGQALGGHKRCHWITSNSHDASSLPKFHFQAADHIDQPMHHHYQHQELKIDKSDTLDLNVPIWAKNAPGLRRDPHNPLSFDVSTDINLRTWIDHNARDDNLGCHSQQYQQEKSRNDVDNNNNVSEKINDMHNSDDEADSKLKLAKLSELNDLKNMDTCMPNSSQWLQVGIGSTTEATANFP